jgi:hypothetical protein
MWMTILLITIRQNSNIVFFFLKKKSEIQASSICFISYENNFFFKKKRKRVTCHRQWWRRWLKWWTWLSFLDADSILRHEYFGIHTHTHTLTPNYSQATTRRTERTTKKRSETDHRLLICVCAHTNFAFLF